MAKSIKYTNARASQQPNLNNKPFHQIGALPVNQKIKSKEHWVFPSIHSNTEEEISSPPTPKSNVLIVDTKYLPQPLINVENFSKQPFDITSILHRKNDTPRINTFLEDDNSILSEFSFESIPRYPHVQIPEQNNEPNNRFTIVPPSIPPPQQIKPKAMTRKPRISKLKHAQINAYAPGQISNLSNMDMHLMAQMFGLRTSELKRIISNKNARVAASKGYVPRFITHNHFIGPM